MEQQLLRDTYDFFIFWKKQRIRVEKLGTLDLTLRVQTSLKYTKDLVNAEGNWKHPGLKPGGAARIPEAL